jgi:para-aminobenzoate synthetase
MKTLVIDHYDSFTFNLVHLLAEVNGEVPLVVAHDKVSWADIAQFRFDNIVLSPGPGRPSRAADFAVSADAIRLADVPILGVCLGHQGIAAAFGAEVTRAPFPVHGRTSQIRHGGDDLFRGIPSPFEVVRYHSLLTTGPLPDPLQATAWTADGLIMALRHQTRPIWGVQFHPESVLTEYGDRLLANFRDLTREHQHVSCQVTVPPQSAEPSKQPESRAIWQALPQAIDCEAAFVHLYGDAPTAFWLDSSLVVKGRSRWSFLGEGTAIQPDDAALFDLIRARTTGQVANPPPCPFVGGLVGWLGYELHHLLGGPVAKRQAETPDALLIDAKRFIAVDHHQQRSYAVALIESGDSAEEGQAWIDRTISSLTKLPSLPPLVGGTRRDPVAFRLNHDRTTYQAEIEQALDWINQGETYQVCLTNELSCSGLGLDPLTLYRFQRRRNPAPHAAFLRWPGGAVMSASPERFLSVDRSGLVQARPIKGTIKRSANPQLDALLARQVAESEKDRAENLMIVDLLRNDLSRVCVSGSVVVPELMVVESYATVHQLVSTVEGRLQPSATGIDAVVAAFPGGSMTGAPKHRTIELIDRLEGRARGVYSGALGWFGADGAADLSIVIRTIVAVGDRLSMGIGGGIVAQSTKEGEFDEMLLKAKGSIESILAAASGDGDSGRYEIVGAETRALHSTAE